MLVRIINTLFAFTLSINYLHDVLISVSGKIQDPKLENNKRILVEKFNEAVRIRFVLGTAPAMPRSHQIRIARWPKTCK